MPEEVWETYVARRIYFLEHRFEWARLRLLSSAIGGGTDEELSDELGVKKTWRIIYDRVATCMPELIPSNEQAGAVIQAHPPCRSLLRQAEKARHEYPER